ncbi:MAG: 50S ribosomal protein L21 [Phycisphaerales bacterium]|jgi:large subunit ribosomal protein L21
MYAIIEESGSQRKVVTGDVISVDLLSSGQATIGQAITFDKVLVVGEVGGSAKVGAPYVAGASVKGEVVTPDVKGEKLYIQKFQAKKTWQKKTGHRQHYTLVKVTSINA